MQFSPRLLPLAVFGLVSLFSACGDDADPAAGDDTADVSEDASDTAEADTTEADTAEADTTEADTSGTPDGASLGLCPDDDGTFARPEGWTLATHCDDVDADYPNVFDKAVVHELTITIPAANWAAAQADLDDLLGGGGGPGGGPGGGGPGGGDLDEEPIWFEAELSHGGHTWSHIGMRFKGNSSLRSAYQRGVDKLSFRLNFDKYEDDNPAYDDQRFYGFKKMTFSNGYKDSSLIRDRVAADIFRAAGVPAARGTFAAVTVDYGQGPIYFGLYTMIEDPSDAMLKEQFGDNDGNLYKPDGDGATWESFIADDFPAKTNEDETDGSDVALAIERLHADRSDAAAWRAGLEEVVDVDLFLRWLAVNQVMVNWDTYGRMTHNYFIYADPDDNGRFKWFPWDLNESMLVSGPNSATATSLDLGAIGNDWPMIRFVLDDAVYAARYRELMAEILPVFDEATVNAAIDAHHAAIAPYVVGPTSTETSPHTNLTSASAFNGSPADLKSFLANRRNAAASWLGQ